MKLPFIATIAVLLLSLAGCRGPRDSNALAQFTIGIEILAIKASEHKVHSNGYFTVPVVVRLTNQTPRVVALGYGSLSGLIHIAELMLRRHSCVLETVQIVCGEKPLEIVNARLMTNPPSYKGLRQLAYRIRGRVADPQDRTKWYSEGNGRVIIE